MDEERIENEEQLEELLSEPYPQTVEQLAGLDGDCIVLGAGGKMGPTLSRLLQRAVAGEAAGKRRVYAVSRFSEDAARERLESAGIHTIRADLIQRSGYEQLPDVANVFFLAGMKFGASVQEHLSWAMNTYLPALAAERWPRARFVVFSTGNVYPFLPVGSGGAGESATPAPIGEYAMSCLGRERIFQYFSAVRATEVVIIRLNYANELRYGVLVDLAQKVLDGQTIDLSMGHVNVIWQGDANNYIARALSLASSPASILNVAGPGTLAVRDLAERIAEIAGTAPRFQGREQPTALLSDASRCIELFGEPRVSVDWMLKQVVQWVRGGGKTLAKPTKFQVRDGKF